MNITTQAIRKAMIFGLAAIAMSVTTLAQAQSYNFGKNIEVAYEGWRPLEDGTFNFMFGYMNNTDTNPNVPDSRNWQGSGNRSVTNMFIDLGIRVTMTDEQFFNEMKKRRQNLNLGPNDHVVGCPLCLVPLVQPLGVQPLSNTSASQDLTNDVALQGASQ
jgi:hypothetical protein